MFGPFLYSLLLHGLVLLVAVFGLPYLSSDPEPVPLIPVEIVDISELTQIQQKKSKPQPPVEEEKPQKPVEDPKPQDKPKPAEPEPASEPEQSEPEPTPTSDAESLVSLNEDVITEEEAVVVPKKKPTPPKKKEEVKEQAEEVEKEDAPKPKEKPKPPKKPEKKKEKKDKKDKKKESNPFDSVLKSVEEMQKTASKTNEVDEESQDDPLPTDRNDASMSLSERDAIIQQFRKCWSVPAGARDAENLKAEIRVQMNADGTVRKADIIDKGRMARDPLFRTAAESALRAVWNPECNPIKVSKEKYDTWKDMRLTFNPKDMF